MFLQKTIVGPAAEEIAFFWKWIIRAPFQPVATSRVSIRLHELDGLRGWTALSVVAYHLFWETFGIVMPSIRNPITNFFLDGQLAVCIFFVLSGEALSAAYFAGKGELAVIQLAVKRYTRLTIPIFSVCVIVFVLEKLKTVHNATAALIVHRQDWLGSWLQIPVNPAYFIKYALVDVYTSVAPSLAVDPILWTMQWEMFGSIVVFSILLSFKYLRAPWLLLSFVALVLISRAEFAYLGCFMFGVIFAAARTNGVFLTIQKFKFSRVLSYILLLFIICVDGISLWKSIDRHHVAMLAVPTVLAVYCNSSLCHFFSNRISRTLGDLSFPLYLVQFPVIISFTSTAIIFAAAHVGINITSIFAIGSASLAICFICAFLFMPVEKFTRYIGKQLARLTVQIST
jgi:peptidoglycan/LPS O-acetylase OafA/YrhL